MKENRLSLSLSHFFASVDITTSPPLSFRINEADLYGVKSPPLLIFAENSAEGVVIDIY